MGVFVPAHPFQNLNFADLFTLSGTQVLFLIGGLAIATGIYTYSKRVMLTVGNDIFKLNPIAALIVVLSESLVLFIFASKSLEHFLLSNGLPAIPLVPVSSSQAVVGGVIGIALAKKGRGINFGILGKIVSGWVSTPLAAAVLSFISLFFVQNVFNLKVYEPPKVQAKIIHEKQLDIKVNHKEELRLLTLTNTKIPSAQQLSNSTIIETLKENKCSIIVN